MVLVELLLVFFLLFKRNILFNLISYDLDAR